ncbi:MAG: hypothetical protein K1000chlam2_00658 [Chlamydiae bacterium]|nr:hypothetical protein [Chlamydiota bacterium]
MNKLSFCLCATFILFCFNCGFSSIYTRWEPYKEVTFHVLATIPGWCSKEKAEILMDFIHETKPDVCVEIGAFGGSTSFPIASALRFNNQGILYAIDAWDNQAAIEGLDANDPNLAWWVSLDMGSIYKQFVDKMTARKLNTWYRPISKRSEQAVNLFSDGVIDLLYIDGNFSSQGSLQDTVLYFSKVKKGGYIWLNDSHSPSKLESVIYLMENATWLPEKSIKNRCIVFRKHGDTSHTVP